MTISIDLIIPIIVGALIPVIMNSNKVTTNLLTISARLADAYYNKKKEKLKENYKDTNDPFELLSLSNEVYKLDYAKKPQLIFVIYLVIYNAIYIAIFILMYLLHYNLLLYILSGFIINIITILIIKIKQKINFKGDSQKQRVT
jgi:hypothetical protein